MQTDLEFILLIAHEIRAPLGIVKESIALVTDKVLGKTNEKQQAVLSTALRNVQRIDRIIMNLVDIHKLQNGKMELRKEPLDFMSVLRRATGDLAAAAQSAAVTLKAPSSGEAVSVTADAQRLRDVLSHLIGNAIKFTPKGGIVEISVRESAKGVECVIQDTGIGIAPEDRHKLFRPFEQFGWVPGGGEKGMGLGLAISKGILELHGGSIDVESEKKRGTSCVITLPSAASKKPAKAQRRAT